MSHLQKQISMTNKIGTGRNGKITQLSSVNIRHEYVIVFSVILVLFTMFLVLSSLHIYRQFSNLKNSISLLLSFFESTKSSSKLSKIKRKPIKKPIRKKVAFYKTTDEGFEEGRTTGTIPESFNQRNDTPIAELTLPSVSDSHSQIISHLQGIDRRTFQDLASNDSIEMVSVKTSVNSEEKPPTIIASNKKSPSRTTAVKADVHKVKVSLV